ncbi:MAG: TIR domain-containing protein [Longimicrobiaceae bacterium]
MSLTNNFKPDPRKVFVVHGRNERLRVDFFGFLRALGLQPIEWSEALQMTGAASPYIGDVLDAAFSNAQAVVVLLTPDDEVRLLPELVSPDDPLDEVEYRLQARPNVLFEAGMALARHDKRTVLVQIGSVKNFSDVAGRYVIRLTDDPSKRKDVAEHLAVAGCEVTTAGRDWLTVGHFEADRSTQALSKLSASSVTSINRTLLSCLQALAEAGRLATEDTVAKIAKLSPTKTRVLLDELERLNLAVKMTTMYTYFTISPKGVQLLADADML